MTAQYSAHNPVDNCLQLTFSELRLWSFLRFICMELHHRSLVKLLAIP